MYFLRGKVKKLQNGALNPKIDKFRAASATIEAKVLTSHNNNTITNIRNMHKTHLLEYNNKYTNRQKHTHTRERSLLLLVVVY